MAISRPRKVSEDLGQCVRPPRVLPKKGHRELKVSRVRFGCWATILVVVSWFEVNESLSEAWQQLCDQTCEENAVVYKVVGHR